jgi:hypothetical protein
MAQSRRTKNKRRSSTPEAPFSAEEERIATEIRESRFSDRERTIQRVVEAALVYAAEQERDDPAHNGRLSIRLQALERAIQHAAEMNGTRTGHSGRHRRSS